MGAQVAVVGAGLAGLHAAWRLHARGVDVVVLEARERVGGRTWSHTLPDGTIVERGGEFIAPGHATLRGLCAELGLALVPHGFAFERRGTPAHAAPTPAELDAVLTAAAARTAALTAAGEDAPAALAFPPGMERTVVETLVARRVETSLTVPLDAVSARRSFGGEDHGYDPADRVRVGNGAVAVELARRLGPRVRLGTPVAAVRHDARGAVIRTAAGERLRTDLAVLALPLPLLCALDLDPGLPPAVAAAAGRLLFGDAAKLHVPLARRPQPGGAASEEALWWCWTSSAADGRDAAPVLSCFAGGTAAVAAVGAADGAATWARAALALRPDLTADATGDALVTHWGADPWAAGSYASPAVGSGPADDAAWAAPWGSVVLAGEHTAGAGMGSMDGAAESGARAATVAAEALTARGLKPGQPASARLE